MKTYYEVCIALAVISLIFLIRKFLSNVIFKSAKRIFPNSFLSRIHTLEGPLQKHFSCMVVFLFAVSILHIFSFPANLRVKFLICTKLIFSLISVLIVSDIIDLGFKFFSEKASTSNQAMGGLLRFYERVSKSCLWIIFLIASVGICGFSISGLLTTVGLGGAALALAAKDSLANFFGSVSLISDKVFKVGDVIRLGNEVEGVVEDIGLRSTRIRTFSRSLIVIPNSILANAKIDNLSYVRGQFVSQNLFFDNTVNNYMEVDDFIKETLSTLRSYTRINSPSISRVDFLRDGLQITINYIIPQKNCDEYFEIRSEVNKIVSENIQRSKLQPSSTSYRFIVDQTA